MNRERAPTENPFRHGQEMVGHRVTLQIQQEQCAAKRITAASRSYRLHDRWENDATGKNGRTNDEVERSRREWKIERICYHPRRRCAPQVRKPMIERNDLCVSEMPGKAPAHVSGTGAYI